MPGLWRYREGAMSHNYRGMAAEQAAAVMSVIAVIECCRSAGFSLEATLRVIEAFWRDKDEASEQP